MRSPRPNAIIPVLLATLTLMGCRETAIAPAPPVSSDGQFHQVQPSSAASRHFLFTPRPVLISEEVARASVSNNAVTSFWAYTDRDAAMTVNRLAEDGTWQPYVTLSIRRGSLLARPNGMSFAYRDSIEITMSVDAADLRVELEPTGLRFNLLVPAQLSISYQDADPDFNHDSVVDGLDEYITQVLLGLSVQSQPGAPWTTIPSYNDIVNRVVSASLRHFSGYAVSW